MSDSAVLSRVKCCGTPSASPRQSRVGPPGTCRRTCFGDLQKLVGGLKHGFLFSISYMGCHPSHWQPPSFFKMVKNHQPDISWLYIPFKSISYRDYIPTYGCNHDCLNRPFHRGFFGEPELELLCCVAPCSNGAFSVFIHGFVEFSIGYYCSKRNLKNCPLFLAKKNFKFPILSWSKNPRNDHYSCLKLFIFHNHCCNSPCVLKKTPPLFFIKKNLRVTHFFVIKNPQNSTCFITCLYVRKKTTYPNSNAYITFPFYIEVCFPFNPYDLPHGGLVLRENLQETIEFPTKIMGFFRFQFSLKTNPLKHGDHIPYDLHKKIPGSVAFQEGLRQEAFNALAAAPQPPPKLRDTRPQRHSGSGATVARRRNDGG